MKKRLQLVDQGLFPETLPPCFNSGDASRAFHGIITELDGAALKSRPTDFIRYNGTKHDRTRRAYGTPNIVSYFHVSSFIHKRWKDFEKQFKRSNYSLSAPSVMSENDERAIKVASLSELSSRVSKSISYAPTILKLDVSQFFASIYTHSIPWARHGKTAAKADQKIASSEVYFNALDFFVRNCQSGQTRGVLVGPDAFRLIAEYISCEIDREIQAAAGGEIVGAVRHVDDYYIGVRSEADAAVVMSRVREALANFELNLNDSKTRIFSSLEPVNDIWAQLLRRDFGSISKWGAERSQIEILLAQSFDRAKALGSGPIDLRRAI